MSAADVIRILPHRHPVLLVDRVVEVVPGKSLTAVKAVSVNEPCYTDLAPGDPVDYPSTLLVESWCQAAVLLARWGEPDPAATTGAVVLFGAIADVGFHHPVTPGCVVRHEVRLLSAAGPTTVFGGRSVVDEQVVMTVGRVVTTSRAATELRA
ncbi:3-hydroxyacyl-[acyl-carrier-protein] dehydratase [Saccharothrix saharensis]|uniref:3-hydroxyacyl-[acyl-carrier-protein] dehydratase n=1 Tax=Saccharothrix saharensis TaxID=571190 RepID=A0A543J6J0_9PSEU|nr:3-hydroxyacyl-ACP dehydratase FabZ family protein [Saccharothrix saharensis]TQM78408.1 3-hydroxyacyl-[acyl-carrier-protein] dehydratase [Saccharothrix saharensis]